MRIAVLDATGRTGLPLVERALERGCEAITAVREATALPSTVRDDRYVHEMRTVPDR